MEYGQSISDAQAAHSTYTAEHHYALDQESLRLVNDGTLLLFREASAKWQRLMGYDAEVFGEDTLDDEDREWLSVVRPAVIASPGPSAPTTLSELSASIAGLKTMLEQLANRPPILSSRSSQPPVHVATNTPSLPPIPSSRSASPHLIFASTSPSLGPIPSSRLIL